jgi:hypothetical protein
MAQELVWARTPNGCAAVSRSAAVAKGYEVLDESPFDANGNARRSTRGNGRARKPRTTVAKEAAKKAPAATPAAENAADRAAEVIAEPASTIENEENQR